MMRAFGYNRMIIGNASMLSGFLSTRRLSAEVRHHLRDQAVVDLAQHVRFLGGQAREARRIRLAGVFHALEQIVDVGALVHRAEVRMRVEHLLEQGRARTRKADHEHRALLGVRRRQRAPGITLAMRDALLDHRQGLGVRVDESRRDVAQRLELLGVRQANGRQRLRGKLELVERGGETKRSGGALRGGIGAVEHGLPPSRRAGMVAMAYAQLRARMPDIVVQLALRIGRCGDGIERNLRELRIGLLELVAALEQQAALRGKPPRRNRVGVRVPGQDGLIQHGEGFGLLAARRQNVGQRECLIQRLRRPGCGALQHGVLARHVAAGVAGQRALQARVDVTGRQSHRFELAGARFLPVLLLRMQQAEMVVQLRLVRRERDGAPQGVFGRIKFAGLLRRDAEVVPVFGHVGLSCTSCRSAAEASRLRRRECSASPYASRAVSLLPRARAGSFSTSATTCAMSPDWKARATSAVICSVMKTL
jgi:hypothetical protein